MRSLRNKRREKKASGENVELSLQSTIRESRKNAVRAEVAHLQLGPDAIVEPVIMNPTRRGRRPSVSGRNTRAEQLLSLNPKQGPEAIVDVVLPKKRGRPPLDPKNVQAGQPEPKRLTRSSRKGKNTIEQEESAVMTKRVTRSSSNIKK